MSVFSYMTEINNKKIRLDDADLTYLGMYIAQTAKHLIGLIIIIAAGSITLMKDPIKELKQECFK